MAPCEDVVNIAMMKMNTRNNFHDLISNQSSGNLCHASGFAWHGKISSRIIKEIHILLLPPNAS